MSERTTPDSVERVGAVGAVAGEGTGGLLGDLALGDLDGRVAAQAAATATAVGRPAVGRGRRGASAGAAGEGGHPHTAEDREHAAPGQPLALDDLGQVVGEAQVVVLELVMAAVVIGHAPS